MLYIVGCGDKSTRMALNLIQVNQPGVISISIVAMVEQFLLCILVLSHLTQYKLMLNSVVASIMVKHKRSLTVTQALIYLSQKIQLCCTLNISTLSFICTHYVNAGMIYFAPA